MKKLLVTGLAALLTSISVPAFAEGKVGIVDVQSVLQKSAYSKRLQETAKTELATLYENLSSLNSQAQALNNKLNTQGNTMSREQLRKLQKQARAKLLELKVQEEVYKEEVSFKEKETSGLVTQKAIKEIESIARAEGYDLILQSGVVLYAVEAVDLTDQVSKALK